MEITRKLVEERKVTTLMVTHNLRFAVQYGTRLVMMHAGQAVLDPQRGRETRRLGRCPAAEVQ